MWKNKRQTKKHKTKARPKRVLQVIFIVIGTLAIVFVIFSLLSLANKPQLVVPVALQKSVKGVAALLSPGGVNDVELALKDKNISYLFVTTATDSAYVVTMPDNAEVLMKKDDIPLQIASLQLILHRLTMEGKRFSRLDLRFDRPVVILSQ